MSSGIIAKIKNLIEQPKFWFYFRKAFFQGFLPILLGFLTFNDFANSRAEDGSSHSHLYFYTSIILFFYAQMRITLEFIFSICAVDVIIKQVIKNEETELEFLDTNEKKETIDPLENYIIGIKKIFRLRYSKYEMFKYIQKTCFFIGIDCPILVPYEVILKMCHAPSVNGSNDDVILNKVIKELYLHSLSSYNSFSSLYDDVYGQEDILLLSRESLPKIELTIQKLQHELFGFNEREKNDEV